MSRLERRKNPRKALRVPVHCGVGKTSLRGFIKNLSASGAGIQTSRVFTPGTDISLRLNVNREMLHAKATIRWAHQSPPALVSRIPSMMGIEFTTLDDGFQGYLQTLEVKN